MRSDKYGLTDEFKEQVFDEVKQKITHFNNPQQQAWIVNANITCAIIGRAGGKTHGFITPAVLRNVKEMKRGATGLVGPTYIKLENDLVPALVKALEKFQFYEGVDFWIKQSIPKNIEHEDPYECPRNPQYSIFFRNGHILRLLGLDRKDSANAQSNDFVVIDEAKFAKQDALNSRIVPTNRGNEDVFGHLHFHHGIMYCTDMPTAPESQWLFEFELMMDQEQIDLIVSYAFERQEMIIKMADDLLDKNPGISQQIKFSKEALLATMRDLVAKDKLTEALEKRFRKELKRLDGILYELRRECVHYIEASTLDNIDVVTERYLRQMVKVLTPAQFDASILGIRKKGADFGFYGNFNENRHTYTDINYDYTDNFKYGQALPMPWRKDADIDIQRPLDIACDWGGIILCMEVGQEFKHAFKVLNSFEVKHPYVIKHLAKKFCDYYAGYPIKKVRLFYDHTAKGRTGKSEGMDYYKDMAKELRALGWTVEEVYIGRTSSPELRYDTFAKIFGGDPLYKKVLINRVNCENLVKSIQNTATIENEKGHKKDKKPERDPEKTPPEHAPHHSDAFDTLIMGVFNYKRKNRNYDPGFMT